MVGAAITIPFAMVPGLEDMGIRLLNECEPVSWRRESIYLAGIDDAHYYRVDNIEKAASNIPPTHFLFCCPTTLRFIATPDSTCC
jgi:hypothetical protein